MHKEVERNGLRLRGRGSLWMIMVVLLGAGSVAQAQMDTPVDLLEDRLAGLEEQSRDVQIQIGALTEFLEGADGRVAALQETIRQLEGMRDNLEDINKKNLIKVIFQLAWETYSTIDETTGTAKTAVESVANYGIPYAAGRLAFEKTSDEARKAMGLDASNYYSSRTVSIRRLTEEAVEQSKEVQKIYWALDKDLEYYRALKKNEEEGEDPGERGAIFFKNEVVRERIGEAIAALEEMISTIETGKTQAQNDLEWLEGEQASIASLMEGVTLQLEQARTEEKEEAVAGESEEMLDQLEDAILVPGFEFRAQREDESDYDYYAERYYAGVEEINGLLDAAFPTLNSLWQDYATSFAGVEDAFDAWGEEYAFLVSFRHGKDAMSPADFGGLIDTLWDWRDADLDEDKLRDALTELQGIQERLTPLEGSFLSYNNTRTGLTGIGGIASASAVPVGETPPEEQRTYTISQYVENEGAEIRFPGADYASISEPYAFVEWYELNYEVEQLLENVSEAIGNAADAADAYKKHYYGLQSAIGGVTEDEQTLVDSLEGAVIYLADTLGEAEALTSAEAFTVGGSYQYFHGIHDHQFTVQALSDAMEEALLAGIRAEPARAQWDAYLDFVAAYEEVARRYRLASQQVLSADSRISGRPPTFLSDVKDALSVAESIGYPVPGNSIPRMESMATAYAETRSFVGELRAWEEARSLKEVRLLEDMTDTVPGEMEEPWINHPLAQALPAFGLLLVKEEMDRRFDALMDMAVRDEDAMWDATYDMVAIVDAWKAAQTDGILGGQLFATADKIKGQQLYEKRQLWERAFGLPYVEFVSDNQAVEPGGSTTLRVVASSKFPISYAWYRRSTFGEDEFVGSGSRLTVAAPDGLESYYCEVSNRHGMSYSGWIDVYPAAKPRIAFQPQTVEATAGEAAQLEASFYMTLPAYIEEDAAWYVSDGPSPEGPFRRLPDSASNLLRIDAAVATRYYYYEVTNPWGTTRTDVVAVAVESDRPALVPPPADLAAYAGNLFVYGFAGCGLDRFAWEPLENAGGLTFANAIGVVQGIPDANAGQTIRFRVRGWDDSGAAPVASDWMTVVLPVLPADQAPLRPAARWFSPQQLQDPAVSSDEADPDDDGLANLLEYALGSNPTVKEADARLPEFSATSDTGVLRFTHSPEPNGFYFMVEYTTDLQTWAPLVSLGDNPVAHGDGSRTVSYHVPFDDDGPFYLLRVRVVSP